MIDVQQINDAHEIISRSRAITNRLMPLAPAAHGFYSPHAFIAGARLRAERDRLYWYVHKRIAEKVRNRK